MPAFPARNVLYHFRLPENPLLLKKETVPVKHMQRKTISGLWVIGVLVLTLTACSGDPESRARHHGQEIWFEELEHDYGEMALNSDGSWYFDFKNIGKEAIVVNRVRSTCGCTIPEWTREPVGPDETGRIKVIYNTAQSGTFLKSLYVYSSASNSPVKLQIKGRVLPAT